MSLALVDMGLATAAGPGLVPGLVALVKDDSALYGHPGFVGSDFKRQLVAFQDRALIGTAEERILTLAGRAMGDMLRRVTALEVLRGIGTDVIIVLPEPGDGLGEDRLGPLSQILMDRATEALGKQNILDPGQAQVALSGHAGGAEAMVRALDGARAGRATILLCADSYADRTRLNALNDAGRLFSDTGQFGLIPGEASAALLLIPAGTAEIPPLALIDGAATGREPVGELDEAESAYSGLSEAAYAAIDPLGRDAPEVALLLSDWNNGRYRAAEFATATLRLAAGPLAEEAEPLYPALAWGDTGAASLPLALAQVLAFPEMAQGGAAMALASSVLSGLRGAVLFRLGPGAAVLAQTVAAAAAEGTEEDDDPPILDGDALAAAEAEAERETD